MTLSGECLIISARRFKGKKGQELFAIKFLDEEGEAFFTLFTTEELFEKFEGVAKRTPVVLDMEITPGQTFVKLLNIEIINK